MWIPRSRNPAACAGVALLLACAAAGAAVDSAAERTRIERERTTVEARARDGRGACASTFSVNACLKRVDAARRDELRRLDQQRVLLDESQRKQRAARRMGRIQQRQAAREREAQVQASDSKAATRRKSRAAQPLPQASAPAR